MVSEIEYAIVKERQEESVAMMTWVFADGNGEKGIVPAMLKPYVGKEPANNLIVLNEILKALPLEVGYVRARHRPKGAAESQTAGHLPARHRQPALLPSRQQMAAQSRTPRAKAAVDFF